MHCASQHVSKARQRVAAAWQAHMLMQSNNVSQLTGLLMEEFQFAAVYCMMTVRICSGTRV
jgi:hypothetical protein